MGTTQQAQTYLPEIARTMPEQYEQQLQQKAERVQSLYSDWTMPELQVYRSPPEHYRMRYGLLLAQQDASSTASAPMVPCSQVLIQMTTQSGVQSLARQGRAVLHHA